MLPQGQKDELRRLIDAVSAIDESDENRRKGAHWARILGSGFFDGLNRRFAQQPAAKADYHVPVDGTDLRAVFCWEVKRSVARDWVVQNDCRRFQISREAKPRPRLESKVTVAQWLDGSIHLLVKGKEIPFEELQSVAGREEVLAS
jgi:hypothetical protein